MEAWDAWGGRGAGAGAVRQSRASGLLAIAVDGSGGGVERINCDVEIGGAAGGEMHRIREMRNEGNGRLRPG